MLKKFLFLAVIAMGGLSIYQAKTLENEVADVDLFTLEAFANDNETSGSQCKWHEEKCSGTERNREVCVVDGNGSSCPCGSVTRPC